MKGSVVATFVALLAGALAHPATAHAQSDDDEEQPQKPPDNGVPGPYVAYAELPTLPSETRACSMHLPLCVHASLSTPGKEVLSVLSAAEHAWDVLAGALGLPTPDVDPVDRAYPVFVLDGAGVPGRTQVTARDTRSSIDRARSFTVFDDTVARGGGCVRDALVAREMAQAFLYRSAPATAEGVARAQTTYLSQLIVPCAEAFAVEETAAFQSRPERAVCDTLVEPRPAAFQDGAALFWRRIDWAYGRGPGSMITAAWALAPTTTDVAAARWHDEPDAFDVLRVSFKNALSTHSTIDDLLLDTAIARAFMGAAEDGLHAPETRALGEAARVPLDWDLPWPTQAKRVAPRAPVGPGGSSYLVIHRAGAPPNARLRVEITWEEHALFRWAFVKLDARGAELGRVVIPTRERATEVQMTLVDAGAADSILLVGTNVGDPSYRFDPDDEVWEPHGWLVTLAQEAE